MSNLILTILQYISTAITGVLGIAGILFNYKDKDTGKITKSGKTVIVVLCFSLAIALISKTIELDLKRRNNESEATRARIASEQALAVSRNVERIVNTISDVTIELELETPLSAAVFDPYRKNLKALEEPSLGEREFEYAEFRELIHSGEWKSFVNDLLRIEVVIYIYPEDRKVPHCLTTTEEDTAIRFSAEVVANHERLEIPEQESRLVISSDIKVKPKNEDNKILSLTDFRNATVIGYVFVPVKTELNPIDSATKSFTYTQTTLEKAFPSLAWRFANLEFNFDQSRSIYIRNFEMKRDSCSGQPFFIASIKD